MSDAPQPNLAPLAPGAGTSPPPFPPGTIVRLLSGGEKMVVSVVMPNGQLMCVWHSHSGLGQAVVVSAEALEKVVANA